MSKKLFKEIFKKYKTKIIKLINKIFYIIIKKKKDTNQISKIFRKKYNIKLKCFVGDLRDRYYAQYNSYNAHGMVYGKNIQKLG